MRFPEVAQVSLTERFQQLKTQGKKILLPYITGGISPDWIEVLRSMAAYGADGIEVGIPFSDPMMDGPVIQEASSLALGRSVTPYSLISEIARAEVDIPLVAMTYYNLVFRGGHKRIANLLAGSSVSGVIIPDLPYDEAEDWITEADRAGVDNVLMAAPTTSNERMEKIAKRSRGFIYGIGLLGVTGERSELAASALQVATALKSITDLPVLVGIGVSTPEQAREICQIADGVIVGSAVVRRVLDGAGPEGVGEFIAQLRSAIDGLS